MSVTGIGVDVAEFARLKRILSSKSGKHFTAKNFTEKELAYCKSKGNALAHMATTFAAKEAVFKAFGLGWIEGKLVEVIRLKSGKPSVELSGILMKMAKGSEVMISMSYSNSFATAFAMIGKKKK